MYAGNEPAGRVSRPGVLRSEEAVLSASASGERCLLATSLRDASVGPAYLASLPEVGRAAPAVFGVGGVTTDDEPAGCVSMTSIPCQPYQVLGRAALPVLGIGEWGRTLA